MFMTLMTKKAFVQLEAASYHVQQPYLRLRDSSFQSEALCVRNPADSHSPASHLQNQVLVPKLKLQPLSVTHIPEVCSKTCDLFPSGSSLLPSFCNHRAIPSLLPACRFSAHCLLHDKPNHRLQDSSRSFLFSTARCVLL